jgi:trk system potassium uptake protein TrkH
MQPRLVIGYVGSLLLLLGAAMATGIPVAWFQGEQSELIALVLSAVITAGVGLLAHRLGRKRGKGVTRRDAFAIVTAAWFGASLFGALPYVLSGVLPGFVDAFFESASGLTTTGSSVIANPDAIPRAILYWRALTQWLGGMGIIVLFVAIFAELGVGGRFLFKSGCRARSPRACGPRSGIPPWPCGKSTCC